MQVKGSNPFRSTKEGIQQIKNNSNFGFEKRTPSVKRDTYLITLYNKVKWSTAGIAQLIER